ncbi:MAG TPA: DNA alkylation repair protein [Gemmataceae bacterium]|jgi:3-methyladenine DNA glycosylase AlkD|nr:DNA alkylation repair protein [Gemmataceae bacterium]
MSAAVDKLIAELRSLGTESIKKVLMKHGAKEPFFGVKIEQLKKIQKRIKKDHALSLALYDTGVSDAMYLAGLISEPRAMTKAQLTKWLKGAYWHMLSCYTVPWVASESRFGFELARDWIESPKEQVAAAGWCTWASLLSIKPDEELDHSEIEQLLKRVQKEIHTAPNRVKYTMNNFVIAVGTYVPALAAKAKAVGKAMGVVEVDMGDTSCQVPSAVAYIEKVEKMGRQGKKRKTAMC